MLLKPEYLYLQQAEKGVLTLKGLLKLFKEFKHCFCSVKLKKQMTGNMFVGLISNRITFNVPEID